jgi:6-phosphogluconolactonase (cycloisomerase 2 family)
MNTAKWMWTLVAAVPFLGGCKDFWQAPASTTTTTTTLSSGYFYVLDAATSQIISYNIVSGVLTEVASYSVPASPLAIAVAPNHAFLYVSTLSGIYVYTVSGGTLAVGNLVSSDPATAMAVDATDGWLVEASGVQASGTSGFLYAIPVSPSTGASLVSSTAPVEQVPLSGKKIHQLAISPNNEFVFVAADTNGTESYTFTAANADPFGTAAYLATPVVNTASGSTVSVAVDLSNRLVYVGEIAAVSSGGGLRAFALGATGGLTEISGSPFPSGGSGPYSILPKATNDVVYVGNWEGTSAGNITGFTISVSNSVYSLSQISTAAATGIQPGALAEDSNGNFVLVENAGGSPYFSAYVFDKTTPSLLDLTISDSTFAGISLASQP